ncbi:hypothetical protein FT637_14890 [Bacillus cereus]|uniref:hypothetical protein n=1 Tax=Bacillus cereus TaxID=1396 RepID=UPI00187ACB1E|nr:hypothetical protein [Bacillus cereus]MBE7104288.1 hypothetical protein [Bacillus cereus]
MDATCILESIIDLKAEAARSEQEGVGTPDYEALFASNEGVKQPTVLAAGAGYIKSGSGSFRVAFFLFSGRAWRYMKLY